MQSRFVGAYPVYKKIEVDRLEVLFEDRDHVLDHVVKPGVKIPAAVFSVFVHV